MVRAGTPEPVDGATVETSPATSIAETDGDGRFSLHVPLNDDPITLTVIARHTSVGTVIAEVTLSIDSPAAEVVLEGPAQNPGRVPVWAKLSRLPSG